MQDLVDELIALLLARGFKLVTAESCTGGLLSAAITEKSGASEIFERGFITYSNEAKVEELEVPEDIIKQYGVVSSETAQAMAVGALKNSHTDIAVSITGIAGPDGGSEEKPVGLVYIGVALKNGLTETFGYVFEGNRTEIRTQTVESALQHSIDILELLNQDR